MVEIEKITVLEDEGGLNLEQGAVAESLTELRDMFFGDPPTLRYELKVNAATKRAAEVKGRAFVRAKHPLSLRRLGVGRVRKVPDSGKRGEYNVTVNTRG